MRRTRARRRFHTDRVIANREAAYRREAPDRYWFDLDRGWLRTGGRLKYTNAYWDCGRPRCGICHGEKRYPGQRRSQEKREWQRSVGL